MGTLYKLLNINFVNSKDTEQNNHNKTLYTDSVKL